MEIDYAEEAFIFALQCHPIAQCAQIVSEMYVACGLRSTKNSLRHMIS
jgi:hypothetical protein